MLGGWPPHWHLGLSPGREAPMSSIVLLVSAEPDQQEKLSGILSRCGLDPLRCETLATALNLLVQQPSELVICEDVLPDGTFRELIAEMRRSGFWKPVIVVSRFDDWGSYLEAMAAGAFDYVAFPPYPRELEQAIAAALAEVSSKQKALVRAAA
jgi:DNA-binding NtrC family response regulator